MSTQKVIKIKRHPSPGRRPPSPLGRGKGEGLPTNPGVYLFKNKKGKVVYVGKATNLKLRVGSYWKNVDKAHSPFRPNWRMTGGGGRAIDEMLHGVARIEYVVTDSVIEALILEANLIRKYMPAYNVKAKDDKSFWYVVVTREQWPKVELVRGNELEKFCHPERSEVGVTRGFMPRSSGTRDAALRNAKASHYIRAFGPYTSTSSIRAALDLIRKWFPWSTCKSFHYVIPAKAGIHNPKKIVDPRSRSGMTKRGRPCFDYHIGRCPGVCIGAITRKEYMKNIRNAILMLAGKKSRVLKNVEREMKRAAKEERFEDAGKLRRKLFALRHIRDIAVITREASHSEEISRLRSAPLEMTSGGVGSINILGRIEGYDISNISGTRAAGSMVVFENGEPKKSEYCKFKIKTVRGINDVAMMREVLLRRFSTRHAMPRSNDTNFILRAQRSGVEKQWPMPDLLVIDGGWGQVNVAQSVIKDLRLKISVVGIAKGFKRKQDRPIFDKNDPELARIAANYKDLLLRVRDEAHRFAVSYHRQLRAGSFVRK